MANKCTFNFGSCYLEKLLCGVTKTEVVIAVVGVAAASSEMWGTVGHKDKMSIRLCTVVAPKFVVLVKELERCKEISPRTKRKM